MSKETFVRIVKAGWMNFRRNSYVSFGTTGVMALVLILFLGLITVNVMAGTVVGSLRGKVDISVYFKRDAAESQIFKVRDDIQSLGSVKYVEYISREQALADFTSLHAGDALIHDSLAQLDANPLPASLNIKAGDPSQYASIVSAIEGNALRTLIDKIDYYENEQVIRSVEKIARGVQDWGFLSTLVLAAIAVLVTFNTIRLTIYNQKQEIEIMRLVGGSNWHIKAPYLVEGAIYGVCAAVAALAVFYPAAYMVSPKVSTLMPGMSLIGYFLSHAPIIVPLMFGTGILLGVISSFVAIRRFLRV